MPERRWAEAELQVGGVRVPVRSVTFMEGGAVSVGYDVAGKDIDETLAVLFAPAEPVTIEFTVPLRGAEWRRFLEGLATPAEVAHRRILGCAHRSRRVVRRRIGRLRRAARIYLRQHRASTLGHGLEVAVARETLRLLARVGLEHPQAWRRSLLSLQGWESLSARALDELEAFAWDVRGRPRKEPVITGARVNAIRPLWRDWNDERVRFALEPATALKSRGDGADLRRRSLAWFRKSRVEFVVGTRRSFDDYAHAFSRPWVKLVHIGELQHLRGRLLGPRDKVVSLRDARLLPDYLEILEYTALLRGRSQR